jgi:hypothetical protein
VESVDKRAFSTQLSVISGQPKQQPPRSHRDTEKGEQSVETSSETAGLDRMGKKPVAHPPQVFLAGLIFSPCLGVSVVEFVIPRCEL